MTRYHLATNILFCFKRIRFTGCGVCTACRDIQTSQKGEQIKMLLDNMKYTTEKKSMQHISGLWGTPWIYIDISTFLEKLFKIIFLIIPIDSIKYLVSFFFYFPPNLISFWDCFESAYTQILIVLCSIYTQGCRIIKNCFVYVTQQMLSNL